MISFLFNAIYYFISFSIALFFILLGIIGIILPWSAQVRTDLIELILVNSLAISLFGFGFVVIGAAWLVNLWSDSQKRYYFSRVGSATIAIDQTIIQHYLDDYWQKQYPQQHIPTHVSIKRNKIKIAADLPYAPRDERKEKISKIQHDIRDIFNRLCGYPHEFVLSLSFQSKK